jgi:hypothetical protein
LDTRAEIRLPTSELRDDLPFYTKTLKMRLDMIYPADDPEVAVLSGHGLRIRIEKGAPEAPGTLRILTDDPDSFAEGKRELVAPNGTRIEIDELNPPMVLPRTEHAFVVRRLADQAPWIIGRAGMEYRDLIPTRLGGAMIASHIRVPDGPVPDMVHFHKVGFQLIFCINGWVDVLYEDQGGTAPAACRRLLHPAAAPSATRCCTRRRRDRGDRDRGSSRTRHRNRSHDGAADTA